MVIHIMYIYFMYLTDEGSTMYSDGNNSADEMD